MATIVWEGGAPAIAQVDTVEITLYHADTTYTLTVNGKAVSALAVTDATGSATALALAWNNSTIPEATEVTATSSGADITLTADAAGVPHTITSSKSGTGTIGAVTPVTVSSGPYDAAVLTNWSTGALPGAGDAVVFENSTVNCLYNLASITAIATFTVKSTFTGTIGLPRNNALGYVEYRPQYFHVGVKVTAIDIGQGSGNGSARVNVEVGDLDTANMTVNVSKTALSAVTGVPAFLFKMATQTNSYDVDEFTVNRGTVGIGFYAGDSAVVQTLNVGYIESQQSDSEVTIGDTVLAQDAAAAALVINQSGGIIATDSAVVTLTQTGGTCTVANDATLATGNLNNGILYYSSTGTLSAVHVNGGAVLDFRRDGRDRIVSAATVYQAGAIYDPNKTVTWTADIDLYRCGIPDVTLDIGEHFTLGIGAI